MTPERKEEIKQTLKSCNDQPWKSSGDNLKLHANCFEYITELLAALEEAQQQTSIMEKVASKEMDRLERELAEAQQTIARQREALEPEQRKSIIDHCSDLNRYDDDNFSAPVCIDELPEEDKAEVMEWLYVLLGACAENAVDSVTDLLAAFEEGETQP